MSALRDESFYYKYEYKGGTVKMPKEVFWELYNDSKEEIERLNKNKNDAIVFIERYLKLNLEAFDTKSLLNKILEIIKRGDYIDSD